MLIVYYKGEVQPKTVAFEKIEFDRLHREDGHAFIVPDNPDRNMYYLNGACLRKREWTVLLGEDKDKALQVASELACECMAEEPLDFLGDYPQSEQYREKLSVVRRLFEFLAEKGFVSDVDVIMENFSISL